MEFNLQKLPILMIDSFFWVVGSIRDQFNKGAFVRRIW